MIGELTDMQKAYIWLAGSYPKRVVVQGNGKRSPKLLYALHGEDEIVLFGYSNPAEFLVHRDLFMRLQARHTYDLTDMGRRVFERLLAAGAGLKINARVKETKVKERPDDL